ECRCKVKSYYSRLPKEKQSIKIQFLKGKGLIITYIDNVIQLQEKSFTITGKGSMKLENQFLSIMAEAKISACQKQ
ncbi:hypothetical protein PJI17_32040, partial [Mycobacterium kansasii]